MDVCLVNVRTDDVGMIALSETLCQLTAQTVCFLRRDLAGTEGLAQMVGNHIIRASYPTGISDVLLLGKKKFTVGNPAVTLPAGNQLPVVGLFWIFHIINDCGDCGSGSTPFADMQRHQSSGSHFMLLAFQKNRGRLINSTPDK